MKQDTAAKWVVTSAEACAFFDISRETLADWHHKGCPKIKRGYYDLQAIVQWRYGGGCIESPEARKTKADADYKEAKAAQEKIKLAVAQEAFVPVKDVQNELTRLLGNLKKSLLAMGHAVASDVAPLSQEAATTAQEVVDKRIRDALTELAEGRLYRAKT